jgi:hypothetical protein
MQTDVGRWPSSLDWTLESGPDEAPCVVDVVVPYRCSGGGSDYFAYGCWNAGDPLEVELGTAWFIEDGALVEVNLTEAECERVQNHVCENPPEDDFEDDY